jgi:uncharacterized HAD superfamily protein
MSKKLTIAVDCDDVLVDTMPMIARLYNDAYGTSLTLADFYQEDARPWGVADIKVASARFHELLKADHDQLVPAQSTIDAVRRLSERHELHLISGRNHDLEPHTRNLIKTYFDGCFATIELTSMYDDSRRRTKGQVCKQIGADVLIDDHPVHIQSVIDEAGLKEVIVFGQYPWNSGVLPTGAVRCLSWSEIETEIDRIAGR